MSTTLVARSEDLTKLVEDGYDIEIRNTNLLCHHVPFATSEGTVAHGILVSELSTNGERTVQPGGHEAYLVGGVPHDHQGTVITIVHQPHQVDFGNGLVADCGMSGKLHGQSPRDYYEKISNYVRVLSTPARVLDPTATHRDFPARAITAEDSVFRYHDAAVSRSGISAVAGKLALERMAIIGLGGTGSYILDQVAKTPVREIHLFDDDIMYAHNAFRAPGAASLDQLKAEPLKVQHLADQYYPLRRNLVPHPERIDAGNLDQLRGMDFVFVAIDAGPSKRDILEGLREAEIPFIDCGMGLTRQGNSLRGQLRVTTGLPGHYEHLADRVSYTPVDANEYDRNIQTADLNMLNAAMAVIAWKKHYGYYSDTKCELNSNYAVARNLLTNGNLRP